MRAAILESLNAPLVIDDIEIADPRDGEVMVQIAACGVCHSDLSVIDGGFPSPLPVVLGHEAAGVVEAVGPGVTSVVPGDHVILCPLPSCGSCYFCEAGNPTLCEVHSSAMVTATMADGFSPLSRGGETIWRGLATGGFAERALMPEAGVVKVPGDVDLSVACVIGCGVQTGVGAVVNTAQVEEGSSVLVLGAGGIGISVTQGARLVGASTIVVAEPDPARRKAALDFGATYVIDPRSDDPAEVGRELTKHGFDYAFESAGRAALVTTALDAVRPGGTAVAVGAPPLAESIEIPAAVIFTITEKRLMGCALGSVDAQRDIPRFVQWWREGRLDLDAMVTARHDLEDIGSAIEAATAGQGLRSVVRIA